MRVPESTTWWTLRVGACLCFLGHGAFGIITKAAWLPFFATMGIGPEMAYRVMPLIGVVDVVLGMLALLQPRAALLAYMVMWTTWTAALRPIVGLSMWEMIERAGNVGVPLALLLMSAPSWSWRAWRAPAERPSLSPSLARAMQLTLATTSAALMIGHGALAIELKPEIVSHLGMVLGLNGATLDYAVTWFGVSELALAGLVLVRPSIGLCVGLCAWKIAAESLFIASGAPVWEFVERGGSYAAPLALAALLWQSRGLATQASKPDRSRPITFARTRPRAA